jgi:hypothetical protein
MSLTQNSLTDKEYYQLTISIGKAFSSFEAPVKSKHVRAAIIGTYHSNGNDFLVLRKNMFQYVND